MQAQTHAYLFLMRAGPDRHTLAGGSSAGRGKGAAQGGGELDRAGGPAWQEVLECGNV